MDRLLVVQVQLLRGALEGQLRGEEASARGAAPQLPWAPGERVSATVDSMRGTERAILRIGNFTFDAPVPPGVSAGQKLQLVFISASPRVTFALPATSTGHADSALPTAGKQVDISNAARRLDSVLTTLASNAEAEVDASKEARPLIQGLPTDAKALAQALQERVTRSGMFYESHLEHWADGRLPLDRLRQEPQGQIPVPARAGTEEAADRVTRTAEPATQQPVTATDSGDEGSDPVHPAALPQVRAQLEALQSGQIAWQGQAWPGQALQIEIEEELDAGSELDGDRRWSSRLRLELPRLGSVDVVLQLTGQQLSVRMSAADAAAAAELREDQPRLLQQLDDARLSLVEFDVSGPAD